MENLPLKKKVLYIITKSNWGGAQRHVFDLATNLPKEEYDIVVAAGGSGSLLKKLEEVGVKTIPIPKLERDPDIIKDFSSIKLIFNIIRTERPDILHLHSTKVGGIGALIARYASLLSYFGPTTQRLRPKIIYTAHGWAFKENRPPFQKLIIYLYSWLTIILNHKTIVVSEDDLIKSPKFLTRGKITMIHNGIAPFQYLPRVEAQKKVFAGASIYPNNLIVGTISELHKNKGLSYVIDAIAELKSQNADKENPIMYSIVSDGEEKSNLLSQIKTKNLQDSVFLAGFVPDANKYLSAFDLFIFPSLKEGLPYALLEAGSIGLPIIATSIGGAKDIITDMETGILIRPKDIKEIANALRFFIQNPEKIAGFGGKLRKRIANEFSLEKMISKTLEIY